MGLLYASISYETKPMYTKLVPSFTSAWKHLYLVYHLYHLFEIIYESIFYNLKITLNYWFISKTINTRGNFIRKRPLGPWYPRNLT